MVALKYNIKSLTLTLCLTVLLSLLAGANLYAQRADSTIVSDVTPRIEGLGGDSTYMALLALDAQYALQSDSLNAAVSRYRQIFVSGGDKAEEAQSKIIELEQSIFKLRTDRNANTSQIETIEEQWRASNSDGGSEKKEANVTENRQIYPTEIVGRISQSNIVNTTLSSKDLQSLIDADNSENTASTIYNGYLDRYLRASELKQLYNQTEEESEALAYEAEFNTLLKEMDSLSNALDPMWITIYDDKIFIYSLLLETLSNNEILQSGLNSIREAETQVSQNKTGVSSLAVIDYMYKKMALVKFENAIADRFNLPRAADSLFDVTQQLAVRKSSDNMPILSISDRSFIPYEPIVYSTHDAYNDTIPIPETKHYVKGTVYRIQLGSYKAKQKPEIFRGASPLSYEVLDGMYTYYGGSYATYVEAEQAAAKSKQEGFNRPEMVVWQDGVRRNLYRNPLEANSGYTVVLDGATALSSETSSIIELIGGGANLVRIATNKYVISPVKNSLIAADLVNAISGLNPELTISITEIQ